jgi:hypothetical protein
MVDDLGTASFVLNALDPDNLASAPRAVGHGPFDTGTSVGWGWLVWPCGRPTNGTTGCRKTGVGRPNQTARRPGVNRIESPRGQRGRQQRKGHAVRLATIEAL